MTTLDRRQFNRSLLAVPAAALLGTGVGALSPAAVSAAPSDWKAHLLAAQANGELMHQVRAGDGSWQASWNKVDTNGTLYYISCAGMSTDLHAVASINGNAPAHCLRNGSDGSWTAFSVIPSLSGPTGLAHVATSSTNRQLQVLSASGGSLYHTVRFEDGTWQSNWGRLGTFDRIDGIDAARVGSTLHVAAVAGGSIIHATRASNGSWSNWGNVESAAGEIGEIIDVALAGTGSQVQVVARLASGSLHHAIRNADGSWQRFNRMAAFSDYTPIAISAADVGGEMQFAIVDLTGAIRHTIRYSDGSWQGIGTVRTTGLTDSPADLALTGSL